MSKVVVLTNLTLDGVMQGPARPDEDRRGGFEHGGWGAPYAAMEATGNNFASAGALLFGRRTYENFYAVWPKQTNSPYTEFLNTLPKYVAGAAPMEQFHAAQRRCSADRLSAQTATGQGSL